MDNTTFFTVLLSVVVGGGIAVAIYAMTIPTTIEPKLARGSVWVAAVAAECLCVWYGGTNDMERWVRYSLAAAIGATIIAGLCAALDHIADKERHAESAGAQTVPPSLFDAQLRELQEISEFIGKKSEIELRETFDFPGIVQNNITLVKGNTSPELVSADARAKMDEFFKGGQARIDTRYAHLTSINNTAHVDWIPGKVGLINISKKYVENRSKLNAFISSPQIPSSITDPLKDFDKVIEDNSTLIIEVLNEQLAENPNNIINNDLYGSPYYGGASGAYWARFVNLRPSAEKVSLAIREYLKIR